MPADQHLTGSSVLIGSMMKGLSGFNTVTFCCTFQTWIHCHNIDVQPHKASNAAVNAEVQDLHCFCCNPSLRFCVHSTHDAFPAVDMLGSARQALQAHASDSVTGQSAIWLGLWEGAPEGRRRGGRGGGGHPGEEWGWGLGLRGAMSGKTRQAISPHWDGCLTMYPGLSAHETGSGANKLGF